MAGLVLAITGGLGGIGALVVRMRSDAPAETARLWRENAEAERARAERLDAAVTELTRRVDRLEAENAALRSVVSADKAIADLSARLDAARAEILAAIAVARIPTGPQGPNLSK